MAQRRPVDIADLTACQVSVLQRRSGDESGSPPMTLASRERRARTRARDLPTLVAVASGDRARERVEDDVLDALADRGGKLLVFEIAMKRGARRSER